MQFKSIGEKVDLSKKIKDVKTDYENDKRSLPSCLFRLKYFFIIPALIFSFIGSVIVFLTSLSFKIAGFSNIVALIPIIIFLLLIALLYVVYLIINKRVTENLIKINVEKLNKLLPDSNFSSALKTLEENNIIKDGNLIICSSFMIDTVFVPIKNCVAVFDCELLSGDLNVYFKLYEQPGYEYLLRLDIDENILAYFSENSQIISNLDEFKLFCDDKYKFVRLIFKRKSLEKINDYN